MGCVFISRLLFVIPLFLIVTGIAAANDEQGINEKIQQGGIVHLSAGTYTLTDSIILQNNVILEGEAGTVLTIPNNAGWPAWKPLISAISVHNITIRNLEIDGNSQNNNFLGLHGQGFYNLIHAIDCDSVNVNNCLFHDSDCDGLRFTSSSNCEFYNNTAYRLGHDVGFFIRSSGIRAYNNRITTRTNSALRILDSSHIRFYNNVIDAQLDSLGGNPGIQIEDTKGTMQDIEISNNILSKTWGAGIWLISYDKGASNSQGISIHHNLFWQVGQSYNIQYTGGIVNDGCKGTQIYNNCFDGVLNNALRNQVSGQGTVIKDNIITDTIEHAGISQTGTGAGIADLKNAELSISNNCFFNNQDGDLSGCSSFGNDFQDPKIHATSSGWTWIGTTWTCAFVPPMDLGAIAPTNTTGTTDNSNYDYWEFLNTELTVSGDVAQKDIKAINPHWQQSGTNFAYIYLAGYQGKISFGNDSYIPVNASDCARILTSTKSSKENVVSQDSSTELADGENNTLIVKLKVKTTYKEQKKSKVTILGKSINLTTYENKIEYSIFYQTFAAPPVFPTVQAPIVKVTYYNGSHAIVIIPDVPGIAAVDVKIGNSSGRQYRLIGEVGTAENGFRSTQYNKVDTWKFTGLQISRSPSGLYIREPFNLSDLQIQVTTPYRKMEVTQYDYVKIEDTSNKIVSIPSITLLFVLVTFGRAIIIMLKGKLKCLRE